jgi:L-lactate dehydrogenase complex protein LldG
MNPRNEILSNLKTTPQQIPEIEKRQRDYPDLAAQFVQRLQASKGEVYQVGGLEQALLKLKGLFEEQSVKSVAAQRESPLDELDLPAVFPQQTWHFAGQEIDYRAWCAQADAGLTSAASALAETGSLVIVPGPAQSQLTSLLPPLHFVMLPQSRILPSIFDWVVLRPEVFPSNLVLVSGPSKTADIEQTLVVGVHGPKRLIVIVYPDSA